MSRSGRSSSSSSSHSNASVNSTNEDMGSTAAGTKNLFKNDGSFLEMFKKMQEAKDSDSHKKTDVVISSSTPAPAPVKAEEPKVLPMVGKRRGGRALPTGLVKKPKKGAAAVPGATEEVERPKDAWSQYMAEVKRYKETSCEEEGKTRPLVK
jgi:hypothetical protein